MKVRKFIRRISDGFVEDCIVCQSDDLPVLENPDHELVDAEPGFGPGDSFDGQQYVKAPDVVIDYLSDRYQLHWLEALTDMMWDVERRLRQLGKPALIAPLAAATTKQEYRDAVAGHVKNLYKQG